MNAKRFAISFVVVLCTLAPIKEVKAQLNTQDSLALVALYNAIPALHSDTTWLHGNANHWNGVYVNSKRVTALDLSRVLISGPIPNEICGFDTLQMLDMNGCDLRGLIPKCLFEMPNIKMIDLIGNSLTGIQAGIDLSKLTSVEGINLYFNEFREMPDFLSIPSPNFYLLDVRYNRLNFDELIPTLIRPLSLYSYAPQQPMIDWRGFVVHAGDSANFPDLSALAGSTNNTYLWKRELGNDSSYALNAVNSPRLKNTNQSMMRVEGAESADGGTYSCDMTNPNLPGLFLKSGYIAMTVITLQPQTIVFTSPTDVYCPFTPLLFAFTTASKPVSFISLNDSIATVNPDHSLTLHRLGKVTIQATAPGDTIYLPDTLNVELTVRSTWPLPSLEITQQGPTQQGKELNLSIPFENFLAYQWTSPSGQLYDTAAITISPFTATEFGTYKMRVTEGTCLINELSIPVNSWIYGKPFVYELITPNSDGDNETFYIENLNPALDNEVTVFNASHQVVFHEENYRNNWTGDHLPVGTYYYIVRVEEKTYKGNLYIKR